MINLSYTMEPSGQTLDSQKTARALAEEFPVSIIMQREMVTHGRWRLPKWQAVGIVAGEQVAADVDEKILIHSEQGCEQYLWQGYSLTLYKDGAESYWYNLMGKFPSLFVICHAEEDGELVPFSVTANYDEAGAHQESDDTVFSIPIPPEIYQWLEHYVVENYIPQEKKKRKRTRWKEEAAFDRRPKIERR